MNSSHSALHIGYREKYVEETMNTNFLGLWIDININWYNHIEQTISNLSGACYAVILIVYISNTDTFKSVRYAFISCIIKYRRIFYGNLSNIGKIFNLHNKIIRIMAGAPHRTSCRFGLVLFYFTFRKSMIGKITFGYRTSHNTACNNHNIWLKR